MSDAPSAKNSSADGPSADATPTDQRKPKSTTSAMTYLTSWIAASPTDQRKPGSSRVGRIIIGILLMVLAVEAFAHIRMTWAKSKLTAELAKAEVNEYEVTRESVKQLLGGEPDLSKHVAVGVGDELYDVYYYNGLLGFIKRRVLCVHYGIQGETDANESQREMMEVLTVVPEAVLYDENL